jgi:hypothetical protein
MILPQACCSSQYVFRPLRPARRRRSPPVLDFAPRTGNQHGHGIKTGRECSGGQLHSLRSYLMHLNFLPSRYVSTCCAQQNEFRCSNLSSSSNFAVFTAFIASKLRPATLNPPKGIRLSAAAPPRIHSRHRSVGHQGFVCVGITLAQRDCYNEPRAPVGAELECAATVRGKQARGPARRCAACVLSPRSSWEQRALCGQTSNGLNRRLDGA